MCLKREKASHLPENSHSLDIFLKKISGSFQSSIFLTGFHLTRPKIHLLSATIYTQSYKRKS
jgi:hypothetical protein